MSLEERVKKIESEVFDVNEDSRIDEALGNADANAHDIVELKEEFERRFHKIEVLLKDMLNTKLENAQQHLKELADDPLIEKRFINAVEKQIEDAKRQIKKLKGENLAEKCKDDLTYSNGHLKLPAGSVDSGTNSKPESQYFCHDCGRPLSGEEYMLHNADHWIENKLEENARKRFQELMKDARELKIEDLGVIQGFITHEHMLIQQHNQEKQQLIGDFIERLQLYSVKLSKDMISRNLICTIIENDLEKWEAKKVE